MTNSKSTSPSNASISPSSTIEPFASQATEAVFSLLRAGHELAIEQSDRTVALNAEMSEATARMMTATFDALTGLGRANLDSALTFNQVMITGAVAYWREMAGFGQTALDKGLESGLRLLEIRSPEELIAIQTGFFKATLGDSPANMATPPKRAMAA